MVSNIGMCLSLGERQNHQIVKKRRSCLENTKPSREQSVPWYDRLYRGVDTPTMQSYNPFRGLHLKKKKSWIQKIEECRLSR